MKAPLVREGSQENGTQVTGNRIYKGCLVRQYALPDQALIRKNSPGVDHAQETGIDCLLSLPIGIKSYPAITVLSPGLGYRIFLCHLAVPVSLCHCITSLASFSSGYEPILMKL